MSFKGSMPAGAMNYAIVNGTGEMSNPGWDDCLVANPVRLMTLHGETSTQSFDWSCAGVLTGVHDGTNHVEDAVEDVLDQSLPVGSSGGIAYIGTCSTVGKSDTFNLRMYVELGKLEHRYGARWWPAKGLYFARKR